MGWYIFGLIVGVVFQIYFATSFASIAAEKGYEYKSHFWVCFVFGIVGFCMVAALPDQKLRQYTKKDTPAVAVGDGWVCSCGRVNANYVSTCTCGVNKRDIK